MTASGHSRGSLWTPCHGRSIGYELRDYQTSAVEAVVEARARGRRRALVAMPTGCGKTVVFANLPQALGAKRTLVIAHRRELLDQAAAKIRTANPALEVQVEQAERRADRHADVVVASIQTIGRPGSPRLERLDPDSFDLVVVDEAHHATASTYRRVLVRLGVLEDPDYDGPVPTEPPYLVGVTATPERGDGDGLGEVFEEIVFERGIVEMIQAGWLCPIRGYRVTTDVDLSRVAIRRGDYATGELADAVNTEFRNSVVVKAYRRHAAGRRAIVFAVRVDHAQALATAFALKGVPAEAVWGGMPSERRDDVLARFRDPTDPLMVVTNCAVLTEGFDDPGLSCVVMARPTRSGLLYRQCVGRGTRLASRKDDLVLIDLADATSRHDLVGAASLVGLPAGVDPRGEDLRAVAEAYERSRSDGWAHGSDGDELESEEVDLFALGLDDATKTIRALSRLSWVALASTRFRLDLFGEGRLDIRQDALGHWLVTFTRGGEVFGGKSTFGELRDAVRAADEWLSGGRAGVRLRGLNRRARWRREPASEKQRDLLRRMRIPIEADLTKGGAAELLERAFARPRGPRGKKAGPRQGGRTVTDETLVFEGEFDGETKRAPFVRMPDGSYGMTQDALARLLGISSTEIDAIVAKNPELFEGAFTTTIPRPGPAPEDLG